VSLKANNNITILNWTHLQFSTQCSDGCQCVLCNFQWFMFSIMRLSVTVLYLGGRFFRNTVYIWSLAHDWRQTVVNISDWASSGPFCLCGVFIQCILKHFCLMRVFMCSSINALNHSTIMCLFKSLQFTEYWPNASFNDYKPRWPLISIVDPKSCIGTLHIEITVGNSKYGTLDDEFLPLPH